MSWVITERIKGNQAFLKSYEENSEVEGGYTTLYTTDRTDALKMTRAEMKALKEKLGALGSVVPA